MGQGGRQRRQIIKKVSGEALRRIKKQNSLVVFDTIKAIHAEEIPEVEERQLALL
jgi:hypothetical protein